MLLAIFFIIGTAIFRGSLNYIIMNAIPSIALITSILMSNSLLLIFSCYGKVGYYPFFLVSNGLIIVSFITSSHQLDQILYSIS